MKCEKCGKNEVAFLYRGNINGDVTEKRLCRTCAEKEGYLRRIPNRPLAVPDDGLWDDLGFQILGQHLFSGELFDDFFRRMPALGVPLSDDVQDAEGEIAPPLLDAASREQYAQRRQRNEWQNELRRAVAEERYEEAARLRDRIRAQVES